jgi:hypothetical protein
MRGGDVICPLHLERNSLLGFGPCTAMRSSAGVGTYSSSIEFAVTGKKMGQPAHFRIMGGPEGAWNLRFDPHRPIVARFSTQMPNYKDATFLHAELLRKATQSNRQSEAE